MRAPRLALLAAALLLAEGVALTVFAVIELASLGAGTASSVTTAVALIVLTVLAAFGLAAFAFGTRRGRSWARSGGVVLQVLGIVVAASAATIPPAPWPFVLAMGLPSLVCFVLLIASTRAENNRAAD